MDMTGQRLHIMRLVYFGTAMALAALLGACASPGVMTTRIAPLQGYQRLHVDDVNIHAVSADMLAFLDHYVNPESNRDSQAWKLVWAVTDRNVLPFRYDPGLTIGPVETFALKTGNCLAFSNMLVAMARQQGLKAWYQEVEIPPQWNNINNTLLFSIHVNVVVQGQIDQWVVDVSGQPSTRASKIKRISDEEALAQYYNNLGAEALTADNLPEAFAYFVKAIETQPRRAYLWSNLAVVYTRNGQFDDAKQSYLAALDMDSNTSIAANNLYLLYEKEGNFAAAETLRSRVERHRRKNPYYLYYLSMMAFDEGRFEESRDMLQKAILLKDREYRFHYEMARTLARQGDYAGAQASLDRALQLAPENTWMADTRIEELPELPE